jgi:hypothetical protein
VRSGVCCSAAASVNLSADNQAAAPSPKELGRVALLIVLGKLLLAAAVLVAVAWLPPIFNHRGYVAVYRGNYGHPPTQAPGVRTMLSAWDAAHYLTIASSGYSARGPDRAFYPLWPWVIRAVTPLVGGDPLVAALLASNLLSLLALLLFYDYAARRFSREVARGSLLLLLVFPSAFFFCLAYSESLFLALSIAMFWLLARERRGWAAAFAAALPLARPVGVLAVLPLVASAWQRTRSKSALLWALPSLVGWAIYLAVMWSTTGHPLTGFAIQAHFLASPSARRLLSPLAFVAALVKVGSFHSFLDSALDRLSFAWFLLACVGLARRYREQADLLVYALAMGFLPAITGQFMSFSRYVDVIFPVFTSAAIALAAHRRSPTLRIGLGVAAVCLVVTQVILAVRYINYYWAG